MIYTHVLNRSPAGVRSPADRMFLAWPRGQRFPNWRRPAPVISCDRSRC